MPELLVQGLTLAAYGMGTVFTFLSLLVGATVLMSKSVNRFSGGVNQREISVTNGIQSEPGRLAGDGEVSPQLLAVITGAIAAHRQNKNSS